MLNIFSQSYSQNSYVKVSVDTNKALIGDQVNLNIELKSKKNIQIINPSITDSIGKLIVVSKSKVDTIIKKNDITYKQKIVLTTFDSGYFQIPSMQFLAIDKLDTSFLNSNALGINFSTLAIDTTKPIKDIKPPLEIPVNIMDYIWYIIGALILIIAIFFIVRYLKNRKPVEKVIPRFDPKIPAHIQALNDLKQLESEKLWQNGYFKEYHSRLTDILRLYLERRFNFLAMESTTTEILDEFTKVISSRDLHSNLKSILNIADMVKFAKQVPSPEDNTKAMEWTRQIVESTIPIEIEDKEIFQTKQNNKND